MGDRVYAAEKIMKKRIRKVRNISTNVTYNELKQNPRNLNIMCSCGIPYDCLHP